MYGVKVKWRLKLLAMLGTKPDRHIARLMGISPQTISNKRRELGIPKHTKAKWTPKLLAMLGRKTDVWLAAKLGVTSEAVLAKRRRMGIPAAGLARREPGILADLGKMPDAAVVKKHHGKVSAMTVWVMRRKMGIAACGNASHKWTKTELRLLGTNTDEAVGKRIGMSGGTVGNKRRELGIARHKRTKVVPMVKWTAEERGTAWPVSR